MDELTEWLRASAARAGFEADHLPISIASLGDALAASPVLLWLPGMPGASFLAVVRKAGRRVLAVGPDGENHWLVAEAVCSMIREPFESSVAATIDLLVERMPLNDRAREKARAGLVAHKLESVRFRGSWRIRRPVGGGWIADVRHSGVARAVTALTAAYVLQYGLFLSSWWVLAQSVIRGTIDRGWLAGWFLLLLSLIPLRLIVTWSQGIAVTVGAASLRRRLLRGALRLHRDEVRSHGAGHLFGIVLEGAAVESLAVTGGFAAVFSIFELIPTTVVLWNGASTAIVPVLLAWMVCTLLCAWMYLHRRTSWSTHRIDMTKGLIESLVGYRTRLVQESTDRRHRNEDESVQRYFELSRLLDHAALVLTVAPRAWLVVALATVGPALLGGAATSSAALTIAGILLVYRALQRLAHGLSSLAGATIAARSVQPLLSAASRREDVPLPSVVVPPRRGVHQARDPITADVREVTFRYRPSGKPVLQECNLRVAAGTRILLEGPSGSGKTTFASVLAGIEQPDSGVLLVGGLDRSALGAEGWRKRVVMAPEAHDNYLMTGSLAFNLLLGKRWPAELADLAEADELCRDLGLGDLLDRMPAGLHQIVGETGWQLSQGEKVRVFLARALLQSPEFLILDESFSALDAENVDRTIRCLVHRSSTVLAIAHS